MLYRYHLSVYFIDSPDDSSVFEFDFSSINQLVKVACGFNDSFCSFVAIDSIFGKILPLTALIEEFKGDCYGI